MLEILCCNSCWNLFRECTLYWKIEQNGICISSLGMRKISVRDNCHVQVVRKCFQLEYVKTTTIMFLSFLLSCLLVGHPLLPLQSEKYSLNVLLLFLSVKTPMIFPEQGTNLCRWSKQRKNSTFVCLLTDLHMLSPSTDMWTLISLPQILQLCCLKVILLVKLP